MNRDDFSDFIKDILRLSLIVAPAGGTVTDVVLRIYNTLPIRQDFHRFSQFPLSGQLNIKAVHVVPGDNTTTVFLSPGEFQINRIWYRIIGKSITIPTANPPAPRIIYADGTLDSNKLPNIFVTSDLTLRQGFRPDLITGTATWVNNSNIVTGIGTSFIEELSFLQKIRPDGSQRFYSIKNIISENELILTENYMGDDLTGNTQKSTLIYIFGEVTMDLSTVTDISVQGFLGHTSLLLNKSTHGHGCKVIVPGTTLLSDLDNNTVVLLRLLQGLKPAHKLMYASGDQDLPLGRVVGEGLEVFRQSSVDVVDEFEDNSWPRF